MLDSQAADAALGEDDHDQDLVQCIEAIARGDFSRRPRGEGPVSRALLRLIDSRVVGVTTALDNVVAQAIAANETAISSGNMIAVTREVETHAQGIAAAIEELVTSVSGISQSSDDALAAAREVAGTTEKGKEAVLTATRTMEEIHAVVEDAGAKVTQLSEASQDIVDIIATIEKIAAQTNLLALNATIEAARAGEAGKGFAVVASEVKNLSQQTANATQDIRERIERLTSEIASIVSSMDSGTKVVQTGTEVMQSVDDGMQEIDLCAGEVGTKMAEIANILSQQTEATTEVAQGITKIAEMSQESVKLVEETADSIDRSVDGIVDQMGTFVDYDIPGKIIRFAKADHVIWKKKLADMIVGRQSLEPDELADNHSCRLGTWYYSDMAADLRDHPAFQALEGPHRLVHEHGIEATRLYNMGDLTGALGAIEKVEEASKDVLALLADLQKEIG